MDGLGQMAKVLSMRRWTIEDFINDSLNGMLQGRKYSVDYRERDYFFVWRIYTPQDGEESTLAYIKLARLFSSEILSPSGMNKLYSEAISEGIYPPNTSMRLFPERLFSSPRLLMITPPLVTPRFNNGDEKCKWREGEDYLSGKEAKGFPSQKDVSAAMKQKRHSLKKILEKYNPCSDGSYLAPDSDLKEPRNWGIIPSGDNELFYHDADLLDRVDN